MVPNNKAPIVSAGADQSVVKTNPAVPVVVNLTGTVSDDGLPSSTVTQTWSCIAGPATPAFGSATSLATTATFASWGNYTLRLTTSDGVLASTDEMNVSIINPNATAYFHHNFDDANAFYLSGSTLKVRDTSGSGNDGSLLSGVSGHTNDPNYRPAQIAGPFAGALDFGGDTLQNYVQTPGWALTPSYAVNFWFRTDANRISYAGAPSYQYFFSWGTGTPPSKNLIDLWITNPGESVWPTTIRANIFDSNETLPVSPANEGSGNTYLEIYDGFTTTTTSTFVDANGVFHPDPNWPDPNMQYHWCDGNWHMLTLNVSAANGGRLYIDGSLAVTSSWGGDAMQNMASQIIVYGGRNDHNASRYCDLDIDEMWMFKKELDANDITSLYLTNVPIIPQNTPPVVTMPADPNLKITGGTVSASLAATVSDDGLPSGTVTQSWTMVSGPAGGTVTFSAPTALTTNATFNKVGAYIVKCLATDGNLTSDDPNAVKVSPDTMTVTVNQGVLPNTAPVITMPAQPVRAAEPAAAGAGGVSLAATVSDDGQPNPPALVTVTWSVISAPQNGVVTFVNSHAATTSASFVRVGTYMLNLHASDSNLDANATCQVVIAEDPRGDFDGLNNCDGTDFLIWQRNYNHGKAGSGAPIVDANFNDPNYARKNGDANGDGKVDGSDFLIWQQDYVYCH